MSEHSLLSPSELAGQRTGKERRVWARYSTRIDGVCQPIAAETASEPKPGWPGEIVDISRGGICLGLEGRFEPGTVLITEVPSTNQEPSRFLEVRVRRITQRPEGGWIHGCELLVKLKETDLQNLI